MIYELIRYSTTKTNKRHNKHDNTKQRVREKQKQKQIMIIKLDNYKENMIINNPT